MNATKKDFLVDPVRRNLSSTVQLQSGKEAMLKWNLTALTYMSTDSWKELFKEVGYKGDFYWFFAA